MLSKGQSSFKASASKFSENTKNKSIVDVSGEQILQLSAPEISFVNTEPNQLYEVSLNVRNVSQFSQKIKVKKPHCSSLTVTSSRDGNLAAGLDLKITVVFDSKENSRISDRIIVATETVELQIPVNVYPNVGKLQFEPFLNFGFVKVGTEVHSLWHITNKADKEVKIKLTPLLVEPAAKLDLSAHEFTLQGGEKKSVTLSLSSKVVGTIEGTIEIEPKEINYSTLEFVANFCEYSRMLSDLEGKEIKFLQIEPLFGGETIQTSAFLVNNAPEGVEYRITRKKGGGNEDVTTLITPEQIGRDDSEKLVQFQPSQGELEPYTSVQIKAVVMGKYDENDQQVFCNYILGKNVLGVFEKEWTYTLRAHLNYDQHYLDLPIKGTSMIPQLSVNPTYLQFSSTPLQQKIKKTIRIENFSSKAAAIQLQNSANYSFIPQKVKIQPKESTIVEVQFMPKKVGDLNEICCLNMGVFSFPIKLFGKCSFAIKGSNQGAVGEEISVEELNRSGLQDEISAIHKPRNSAGFALTDLSKNSIHFDSYRQASTMMSQPQEKSLHVDIQKRTRLLRNKNGKEQKFDANSLNANQPIDVYPATTKNQQEERLVTKELTSLELRNIAVGPVSIDMGTILLRSVQKKYFHICNFNQKPIAIRLEAPIDNFAETSEQRQILPGQSRGGFPIVFEALTQGPFKYTLQYVLNGSHFFQLMISGTTVLPSLVLSKNKIDFTIGEEDRKFQKKQVLKLQNPFDSDVSFEWSKPANSAFMVEPSEGVVKPHSFVQISFVYNFQTGAEPGQKIEQSIKLKVKHGKSVEVKCSSLIPESPCLCKAQQIQFKEVAIGRTCQVKIHIKNMSKIGTIYRVNIPKEIEHLVSVGSKAGSISAEEMAEICFKFLSNKTLTLDNNIQIAIRGSKNVDLPIRGKAILPQVKIEGDQIDFGSVPIEGNPAEKQITLINQSEIPVDLELRLHNQTFLSKCLALGELLDSSMIIVDSKDSKTYKVIYLRVAAKCKTVFTLTFEPEIAEDYQFYLPLFLPNSEPMDDLQKVCRCKGIKNRLMALTKEVLFGKIVIEQAEQIYCKSQMLQIFNPQEDPITWWVDQTGLAPFRLDKKNGRLEGYEKCQIKVFFSAEAPGDYSRELKFFIDQSETDISKCYMKVQMSASACFPTIYFDQPYLILPTVNCGELSTSVFQIFNGGYQNINLKHAVVQQFSNIDLRVKYLNGSNLGVTRKQIKIEVSFVSDKPVSFTVKLSFFDNSGRTFTMNVSGTADTHTYTIIDSERSTAGWGVSLDKSCHFLKHFLNSAGHLSEQLYEFPKSLMENEYQKLAAILSNYSPAFDKVRSQVKKSAKIFFSFEYVSQVIKLLKAEGAFLNHIRPEMLLTYEQYLENIKIRADNNMTILGFFKKKERSQFQLEQKQSWLILFYQIFKVFSRVNPGKIKNNSEFWLKFQLRQKILTSWLQKTYLSQAGIDLQSKTSEILSTMNNCELLAALISKYTNLKILECYGKNVKTVKQKEKRCKAVIDTFSQIGINCLCSLQDLVRSSQKQMLLVIENLYLILPSYLQKGEPIVFSCQFGQVVTKSVEITNPSKHLLSYVAKIEGTKAYSIEGETEFEIESKKTHEVKIKYISNMNMNNAQATLTLAGKASNKFTPSTFVFVLKSNNLGRISEKSVQITGNLYEQLDFSIKVTNNFTEDADFKIELVPSAKSVYTAFYLPLSNLKIKKGETIPLNMIFLPFMLDIHQALLIFKDQKVGEFQYELNGNVESNILCQEVLRVPQVLFTNKKYTIELPVPTRNDLLFRARKAAEFLADRLEKRLLSPKDLKNPQQINYYKYYPKLSAAQTFTAKLSSPNNSIVLKSDQIVIKDIDLGEDPAKNDQKLVFDINLKSAIKEGSFTVNLRNGAGTDIRKYKVTLSAVAKPLRYELEMKIATNKVLSQPLPLINLTMEKNVFHVLLIPSNELSRNVFSIDQEREVIIDAKEQGILNLSFKPRQQTTYNAVLKVENVTAAQNIEYQIVGIGEEPETETIHFEQQVRKEKTYSLKLPITKLTRCVVQSFELDYVSYQKNFQCSPDNPTFKFKVSPKMSGQLEGKLIIEGDQTVWAFRIVINVKNIIEGEIKMRTVERREVSASIALPLGHYRVNSQDYNLKYPSSVTITQANPNLEVSYYSSKPEQKEILLTLIGDNLGELTYLVKVIVQPMPEIKMEPFQIELGKLHREKVIFDNTDDVEMSVSCKSSHPDIFYPEVQKFVVPPRSKFNNEIIYRASSLQIEEGKLYFVSDRSAKWTYHLSGYGLPQIKAQVREMTVNMGEHICEPITFRNPLNKTLQYIVSLENLTGDEAFSMLLKSSKIDLDYNQQIEIPITIKPKAVTLNTAILKIFVNEKISWKYELRAKTVYVSNEEPKTFKILCREKVEQPLQLPLPYGQEYNGQNVKLHLVNAGDHSDHSLIKNAIKIEGGKETLVLGQKVGYTLNIMSFKPKNVTTLFEICAQNGCKWVYKIKFTFLPPPVDDELEIATGINKPASVKFKLTNRMKTHAKFKAYFTSESSVDFTVNPKVGELQPYGREGTSIQVIFCPTQYKKSWGGKLIIETDESFWSYDVKGVLPHYNPPVGKSSLKQ